MAGGNKQIFRYSDVRTKMVQGLDILADPVRETMSPKGRNVLFQADNGDVRSTNDGATIAKSIRVKDQVMNAMIEMVKGASLKTNTEVGDGTSTSILLSQVLIKEGFKLIDAGWNQMDVKRFLEDCREQILAKLKTKAIKADTDKALLNVARVSSNNDEEIAKDVLKVVKIVQQDGMVFLDLNNKPETEIVQDTGFLMETGMFSPELRNNPKQFSANYVEVPLLITDKRIYYQEEAEHILETVLLAGHKSVVIVARDFIGQSVNTFIANHTKGVCNVLLVKAPGVTENDAELLHDLATYMGGSVISEKSGSLVGKLTMDDFSRCDRAYSDGQKTILSSGKKRNKALDERVAALRKELAKDKDDEKMKKRIASLTNGMVTIKVGGATQVETIERIFRYEDAVHATRAALKDGYLIGGGVTLASILDELDFVFDTRMGSIALMRKYCEANIRQIAENCGEHPDSVIASVRSNNINRKLKVWKYGYNAVNGQVEDLEKAGVLDPYKVTEMAVMNSISVASQILSSNFLVIHDVEDDNDNK